jgi:outer membrane PBP1 activator LpoA protein
MTREEQNAVLSAEHTEANRYMDNAKETLKKTEKRDDGYYTDAKYVRSACGIAYLGVLSAVEAWLALKGVSASGKKKKSIDYYTFNVAQLDKKMLDYLNTAYNVLHLDGYYRGERRVATIKSGFDAAYEIIDKIKPENPVDVPETRGGKAKRAWNALLISAAVMFMRNKF